MISKYIIMIKYKEIKYEKHINHANKVSNMCQVCAKLMPNIIMNSQYLSTKIIEASYIACKCI